MGHVKLTSLSFGGKKFPCLIEADMPPDEIHLVNSTTGEVMCKITHLDIKDIPEKGVAAARMPEEETAHPREEWEKLVAEIDEMLEGDGYLWAEDTLSGIRETVSSRKRCTPGQVTAVHNIRDGGKR